MTSTLPSSNIIQATESELSDFAKKYVQENNLVSPLTYRDYQKNYKHDHFFEKSILTEINGLSGYNVFMEKHYYDVITDEVEATPEETHDLHSTAKMICVFTTSSKVQGHIGIIHGGFTSTLFDNLAGTLAFTVCGLSPAATAYLNVTYKKPMKIGKEYILIVEVSKLEGKKIFIKGKFIDEANNVYTEIDSLFLKVQMQKFNPNHLDNKLQEDKAIHDEQHKKERKQSENSEAAKSVEGGVQISQ